MRLASFGTTASYVNRPCSGAPPRHPCAFSGIALISNCRLSARSLWTPTACARGPPQARAAVMVRARSLRGRVPKTARTRCAAAHEDKHARNSALLVQRLAGHARPTVSTPFRPHLSYAETSFQPAEKTSAQNPSEKINSAIVNRRSHLGSASRNSDSSASNRWTSIIRSTAWFKKQATNSLRGDSDHPINKGTTLFSRMV
jgi:hypothetical protein